MAAVGKKGLLPLALNVKRATWRVDDPNFNEADVNFHKVRTRALERDDFSCRFCGFRSPKWQEVHHFDDNHSNNTIENLVTACQYCHMCQHIGLSGLKGEAVLAWVPELKQVELNHVIRVIQVARTWAQIREGEAASKGAKQAHIESARSAREVADAAGAVFAVLQSRKTEAKERFKTDSPLDLANVLLNAPDDAMVNKDAWNEGLRLLPLGIRKQQGNDVTEKWIEAWMGPGGAFMNFKPDTWMGLFRTVALR